MNTVLCVDRRHDSTRGALPSLCRQPAGRAVEPAATGRHLWSLVCGDGFGSHVRLSRHVSLVRVFIRNLRVQGVRPDGSPDL